MREDIGLVLHMMWMEGKVVPSEVVVPKVLGWNLDMYDYKVFMINAQMEELVQSWVPLIKVVLGGALFS